MSNVNIYMEKPGDYDSCDCDCCQKNHNDETENGYAVYLTQIPIQIYIKMLHKRYTSKPTATFTEWLTWSLICDITRQEFKPKYGFIMCRDCYGECYDYIFSGRSESSIDKKLSFKP